MKKNRIFIIEQSSRIHVYSPREKMFQSKKSYSRQMKINGWCRKISIEASLGSWCKQKQTCIQMIYIQFSFSMNNSCSIRNKSADISIKRTSYKYISKRMQFKFMHVFVGNARKFFYKWNGIESVNRNM